MKKLFLLLVVMLMLVSCEESRTVVKNDGENNVSDSDNSENNDVEDSDDSTDECTDGKTKCQGDFVYKCEASVWEQWEDCSFEGKKCTVKDGEAQCLDDGGDTGNTGNTGNTGDTGDTGNSGDTGNTGDSGTDIDEVDDADVGNTGDTGEGTITKIQKGEVSENSDVTFEAVVVAVVYHQNSSHQNTAVEGLFVSELIEDAVPYSGIYVYISDSALVDSFARGDKVEVSGTYKEHYNSSQIETTSSKVKIIGVADVPNPAEIADTSKVATPFYDTGSEFVSTENHGVDSEKYESVFIKVFNVEITVDNLGYGAFEVNDDLAIDKTIYYYEGDRNVDTDFASIKGVLLYSFDAFKLAPRKYSDFEPK